MTERAHHQDRPTPLLATEEERQLIGRYRTGSQKALETLIQSHMPLVRSIARRYRGHARHDDDLLAEGRLGLLQAAQRFEPERGVRFAVYAAWWVRAFVRRYALDNRRIVRAPSTRMGRKLASKLPSTVQKLRQTRGREVSDARLRARPDQTASRKRRGCRVAHRAPARSPRQPVPPSCGCGC